MGVRSNAWKDHERITARYFGVERRSRGDDFSKSDVEVLVEVKDWLDTEKYSNMILVVECKYRKEIGIVKTFKKKAAEARGRVPILRIGNFLLCYLNDFKDVFLDVILSTPNVVEFSDNYALLYDQKQEPKYLQEFLDQSQEYCKTLASNRDCIPLLSLARAGTHGRIVAIHVGCVDAVKLNL